MKPWHYKKFYEPGIASTQTVEESYVRHFQKVDISDIPEFLSFISIHSGDIEKMERQRCSMALAAERMRDPKKAEAVLNWLLDQNLSLHVRFKVLEQKIYTFRTHRYQEVVIETCDQLLDLVEEHDSENVELHTWSGWPQRSLKYFTAFAILKKAECDESYSIARALQIMDHADKNEDSIFELYDDYVRYLNSNQYHDAAIKLCASVVAKLRKKHSTGDDIYPVFLPWLYVQGEILMDANEYESAIVVWTDALSHKESCESFHSRFEVNLLWRVSHAYMKLGNIKKMKKFAKRALSHPASFFEKESSEKLMREFLRIKTKKQMKKVQKLFADDKTGKKIDKKSMKSVSRLAKNIAKNRSCVVCNKQSVKMKRCCNELENYCSQECQKRHWNEHKKVCTRRKQN